MPQSLRKLAGEFNRDRWSTYAAGGALLVGLAVVAIKVGIDLSSPIRPRRIIGGASLWGIAVGLWIYAAVAIVWLIRRLPSAFVRLSPLVICAIVIGWALNTDPLISHHRSDWLLDVVVKAVGAAPVAGAVYAAAAAYAAWVSKGSFRE